MEHVVLPALLPILFQNVVSLISDLLKLQSEAESELANLKDTFMVIQASLKDADKRQLTGDAVWLWLGQLREVSYEANDLLDKCATEVQRQQLIQIMPHLRNSMSIINPKRLNFKRSVTGRIKKISRKLDEIAKRKDAFVFTSHCEEGGEQFDQTTPLTPSSVGLGRENDKREIIKLLMSGDGISVIPVLGMNGLGKTTLAQLVYNDTTTVDKHFELRLWAHVSRDFNVNKIIEAILASIDYKSVLMFDPNNLVSLQERLGSTLMGRRYLLVLDDVSNVEQHEWEKLRDPLLYGANGSKILVTTRSEQAVRNMSTLAPYRLGALSDDHCLSLFYQHALGPNPNMGSDLGNLPHEIASKSKGLPLAAKAIGIRLKKETDKSKWGAILRDWVWEFSGEDSGVLRSVRLSYGRLPAYLKPCFAYCSVFPKDFLFEEEELVQLWMAQNFIQATGTERIEDVGGRYFNSLVELSFFQHSHFHLRNNRPKYTMHDLIHGLAQHVSGECGIVDIGKENKISEIARHSSLIYTPSAPNTSSGQCPSYQRGILERIYAYMENKIMETARHSSLIYTPSAPNTSRGQSSSYQRGILERIYACKGLYTLLASGTTAVPDDLAKNLKRLRSLDFSNASTLSYIPESIGDLKHLRYLQLRNTNIKRLPNSVSKLYNLQTLGLGNCYALEELPKDTSNLRKLRHLDLHLDDADADADDSSRHPRADSLRSMPPNIGELKDLQTLSRFVISRERSCGLRELQHLKDLHGDLRISNLHLVLNQTEANDTNLSRKGYLRRLELWWSDCNNHTSNSVSEKEVLQVLVPHPNLKQLKIVGYQAASFPSWVGNSSFNHLETLVLSDCKRSEVLPTLGQLPVLKALHIKGMDGVTVLDCAFCGFGTQSFPALEKLHFERMHRLEQWRGNARCVLPALRELVIKDCVNLWLLDHKLPHLEKLEIEGSARLIGLPLFPSLRSLDVKASGEWLWKSWPAHNSLSSRTITRLPMVNLPSGLLGGHAFLRRLEISHCDRLTSLPDCWLPLGLNYFAIRHCPQLRALHSGLSRLTALVYLRIEECPQLNSLPSDGLPTALQSLSITNCPLLAQGLLGQDSYKIRYISSVRIE